MKIVLGLSCISEKDEGMLATWDLDLDFGIMITHEDFGHGVTNKQ